MTLKDLKKFALEKGVEPLGSKMEIIRAIQVAEGYQACFGTRPIADCPEMFVPVAPGLPSAGAGGQAPRMRAMQVTWRGVGSLVITAGSKL